MTELKKWEKKHGKVIPSDLLCDYVYASALAGRKATSDMLYIVDRLTDQPAALSIYGKAATAIILHLYGRDHRAADHLESLRQYTVHTQEMGRYFDTPKAHYSWRDYRIPTQVAAIEALTALTPDDHQTIVEMQQWLLQEKRTTMWDTPVNCADAVWSLLRGNDMPTSENTTMAVDGQQVESATAGTGYTKTSIEPSAQTLSIEKHDEGISWGTVYAQYIQPAKDIEAQSFGLTVKREVLDGSGLHVGDKVRVRLTIRADRDYDFVQVVDKRAACLEPVEQTSGYRYGLGCYVAPQDRQTCYFFSTMAKGTHIIETEYYIDREGQYQSGTCTAQCAYAPEFMGRTEGITLSVDNK